MKTEHEKHRQERREIAKRSAHDVAEAKKRRQGFIDRGYREEDVEDTTEGIADGDDR